jgi:hypothetical protein
VIMIVGEYLSSAKIVLSNPHSISLRGLLTTIILGL